MDHISNFITSFPLLIPTVQQLNEHDIPWMIGGSGCLYLLGNERKPDDIDLFLPNNLHDNADKLFGISSYTYESSLEKVRNSNPEDNHSIQLTSHLVISVAGKYYGLHVTQDMLDHRKLVKTENLTLWLMPPEDVLIVKAITQRGKDVGKHDLEDIKNFMKIYTVDHDYLHKRIVSLGAEKRVGNIFT